MLVGTLDAGYMGDGWYVGRGLGLMSGGCCRAAGSWKGRGALGSDLTRAGCWLHAVYSQGGHALKAEIPSAASLDLKRACESGAV